MSGGRCRVVRGGPRREQGRRGTPSACGRAMPASVRSWASPHLSSTAPRPEHYCRYIARPGAAVNDGAALNARRLAPRRPDQGQSRLRPAGISPHRRVETTDLAPRIQRIGNACVRVGCDEVAVPDAGRDHFVHGAAAPTRLPERSSRGIERVNSAINNGRECVPRAIAAVEKPPRLLVDRTAPGCLSG
jgi:hypothetical protein